jgi:glycosyltransferase involved in cell wall biosynthesis
MHPPTVSFVVPCYKLAHLLRECVDSILIQSYGDLEVLIMDDCSPDNTAEVARSFTDPRVRHIRNDPNLGHLRNYNKGIGLARGKYVWLISADDYLGRDYVVKRYVDLLEAHPRVGYTFCPGFTITESGHNSDLSGWVASSQSFHGNRDHIFKGHDFLKKLVKGNTIVAASGLARRDCYEKVSLFPLDMPWAGDWYLWCLFALHYDVGYFAEPMVCYREHQLSMTNRLWDQDVKGCCAEDIAIPWAIKRKADDLDAPDVSRSCLEAVADIYARSLIAKRYRMSGPSIDMEMFERSLCENTDSETERNTVRARVLAGMGNEYYWRGERLLAQEFTSRALKADPWMMKVWAKQLLFSLGGVGDHVRNWVK